MSILLLQALMYAVLLSGITLAAYQASQGYGGLLSPLRSLLEEFGRSGLLEAEVARMRQLEYDMRINGDLGQRMRAMRDLEYCLWKQGRYAIWRKPILLCHKCMPSLWGIVFAIPMYVWYDLTIPAALIGICFSSIINDRIVQ